MGISKKIEFVKDHFSTFTIRLNSVYFEKKAIWMIYQIFNSCFNHIACYRYKNAGMDGLMYTYLRHIKTSEKSGQKTLIIVEKTGH